jgi:hypothetical protein
LPYKSGLIVNGPETAFPKELFGLPSAKTGP